jgi:hypothetical protein
MKPRHTAALALVGWYLMLPPLSAADSDLTYATKAEAEAATDAAARHWCDKNYPGWPALPV